MEEFKEMREARRQDWRDVLKCDAEKCNLITLSEILDHLAFVDFSEAFREDEVASRNGKVIGAAQLCLQYALQSLKDLEKQKEMKTRLLKQIEKKTERMKEKTRDRKRDRIERLSDESEEINHILGMYQQMLKTLNPTLYAHVQSYEEEQEKIRKERDEKRKFRLMKRGEEERKREARESAVAQSRDEALKQLETQRKEHEQERHEWKMKERDILASLAESESKVTKMEINMLSSK